MNTCQFILDKLLKTKYQMHDVWAFRKLCHCVLGAMETSLNGYTSLNFCNMTLDESGYQEFCSARIELLPGTHLGWNCWWRWYLAIMLWYFNYRWTARWMQFVLAALHRFIMRRKVMVSSEQHSWNTAVLLQANMGASASLSVCVSELMSDSVSLSQVFSCFQSKMLFFSRPSCCIWRGRHLE